MQHVTRIISDQPVANGADNLGTGQHNAASLQVLLEEAVGAHQAGHAEVASGLYRQILEAMPNHPDALQLFGLLCKQQGDLVKAEALMRHSLDRAPNQPGVHNNLGNVLARLGKGEAAIHCYREAIALKKDYAEAWYNLGVALSLSGENGEAIEALEMAIAIAPGYGSAFDALGTAYKEEGRLDEAVAAYHKVLDINPDDMTALHNLGVVLKMSNKLEGAVACFRKVLAATPDVPEAHYNLGNALLLLERIEEARASYEEALVLKPDFEEAHYDLNQLLWTEGRHDEFLQSYPSAIQRKPESLDLWLKYVEKLLPIGALAPAEETLRKALDRFGPSAELYDLLAKTLSGQGRADEALEYHNECLGLDDQQSPYLLNYGLTLLKLREHQAALEIFEHGMEIDPLDQELIAYRNDCWRLLGDPRHDLVNDYERMIRVFKLPLPRSYNDTAAFTRDLNLALDPLHSTVRQHPMDQTLRQGSQSREGLFKQDIELVQLYQESLKQVIGEYIDDLDDDPSHPLYARKCEKFRFSSSFTVRLRDQGYHNNHIHPAGWLSCCFYVSLPPEVADTTKRQGWINFGQPAMPLDPPLDPIRYIQPVEGVVAVFPSYLWHGTIPFNSDHTRTTIVADILPDD